MKFKIPTEGGDESINMAPMIDLVFLLLIFFMAASHLTRLERIPVELPEADRARVPETAAGRQIITLMAADDSGAEMEIFMNLQKMDFEGFVETLHSLTVEEPPVVYLRADRRLRHRHVRRVLAACGEAGIMDVVFAALEAGDPYVVQHD